MQKREAFDGIRTRDLSLTKRVLCQLSYEGTNWRIRVSIPVPHACKARTLPIELIPRMVILIFDIGISPVKKG